MIKSRTQSERLECPKQRGVVATATDAYLSTSTRGQCGTSSLHIASNARRITRSRLTCIALMEAHRPRSQLGGLILSVNKSLVGEFIFQTTTTQYSSTRRKESWTIAQKTTDRLGMCSSTNACDFRGYHTGCFHIGLCIKPERRPQLSTE